MVVTPTLLCTQLSAPCSASDPRLHAFLLPKQRPVALPLTGHSQALSCHCEMRPSLHFDCHFNSSQVVLGGPRYQSPLGDSLGVHPGLLSFVPGAVFYHRTESAQQHQLRKNRLLEMVVEKAGTCELDPEITGSSVPPLSLHCEPSHCPRSGHCFQGYRPKGAERCGGHLDRIHG